MLGLNFYGFDYVADGGAHILGNGYLNQIIPSRAKLFPDLILARKSFTITDFDPVLEVFVNSS